MSKTIHDPYLNTVKRSIQDKYYKKKNSIKKESIVEEKRAKGFLKQEFYLSDYINISEEIAILIGMILFTLIPYTIGIIFIFTIIAKADYTIFKSLEIGNNLIYWSIGYELIAFFILFMITKSAINFKKNNPF